ncbi:histidine phosphatase family protein [Glycomyces sp. NPDC048151]|uniref:histidine phosphatase family protein n=1 Tax=Glycomyces sp. NPDC048151 TaxID=3364002 RepID=UPI00371A23C6
MISFEFEAVFLARHGQTEWNALGRKQGRLDSPLTELGVEQARGNAKRLDGEGVDAIFSSPIGRARASADLIAEELGLPVWELDDLSEVDYGHWSGLTGSEIESRWPAEYAARELDRYGYRVPGGESYADVDLRSGRALDSVAAAGKLRPLLVSHEMIGRMLLKHLCRLSSAEALQTRQPNDVVYRIGASRAVERLA